MDRNTITTILVGKTGSGKSLLANRLLGLEPGDKTHFYFKVGDTSFSARISLEPQAHTKKIDGRTLRVIDTPGFFDKELTVRDRWVDVLKAVEMAGHQIDAIIVVVSAKQLASGADCMDIVQKHMGNFLTNRVIIVFTNIGRANRQDCEGFLVEFNRNLKNGILGAHFVFSEQKDPAIEDREQKMREIYSLLDGIKAKSPTPIKKENFRQYTEEYFREKVDMLVGDVVEYENLEEELCVDIALLERFLGKEKMKSILNNRNDALQEDKQSPKPYRCLIM